MNKEDFFKNVGKIGSFKTGSVENKCHIVDVKEVGGRTLYEAYIEHLDCTMLIAPSAVTFGRWPEK